MNNWITCEYINICPYKPLEKPLPQPRLIKEGWKFLITWKESIEHKSKIWTAHPVILFEVQETELQQQFGDNDPQGDSSNLSSMFPICLGESMQSH